MELGKTFYAKDRDEWRNWLEKNHDKEREIWLIYHTKTSGKPFVDYDAAVEEALCFGWIDSTVKKLEGEKRAQRFSPRNPKSSWSEMNKERVRRLIKQGKMAPAGLALIPDLSETFEIPSDILQELKKDKETWENFEKFPENYKRIRIGWIRDSRKRQDVFKQRLDYFLKMTKQNKRFGMVQ